MKLVGNKEEKIPNFSLEITQLDFTKRWQRLGVDQVTILGPSHCLKTNHVIYSLSDVV